MKSTHLHKLSVLHEGSINVELGHIIDDDCASHAPSIVCQQMPQQRGLARSQEAAEQRHR